MVNILKIYQFLFFTGILYTGVSFLLGNLFDFMNIDAHVDFHGETPHFWLFPIRPILVVIFIIVFGGVGAMQTQLGKDSLFVFVFSLLTGSVVSFVIQKLIINPLYKAQNTSSSSQKELIGEPAFVINTIMKNGFGRISYVKNGNTYAAPSKHVEGKKISQGTKVIIVSIKDNIFYIDDIEKYQF